MKKTILSMSLLCLSSMALAQNVSGYLVDSRGAIVKSGTGLCIRTNSWTPSDAVPECDETIKTAPPIVQTALKVETLPEETQNSRSKREVLSADVLFGFNKYNLTAEGKETLSDLAQRTPVDSVQSIEILGYTDPIGTEEYNLKLSRRRAESVKTFLLTKGFDSQSITTEGRGKTELKVTRADCQKINLIFCLSPDRRVDISVQSK